MNNKYQEALDKLMSLPIEDTSKAPTFCRIELGDYTEIGGVNIEECRTLLQELIDNYEFEYLQTLNVSRKREQLEKALDKACKCMSNGNCCNGQLHYCKNDDPITITKCYNCWKEWCLRDE